MVPAKEMIDNAMTQIASTAGGVIQNKIAIALIKVAFTPAAVLALTAADEADFAGYAEKTQVLNKAHIGTDPITGRTLLFIDAPVGGWSWTATGVTDPPQTVYGYVVQFGVDAVDFDGDFWLGSDLFPVPLVIQDGGDRIVIPEISFLAEPILFT